MSYKAVIFDFDGVILDSANIKTEAFVALFGGYPQHSAAIQQYHLENQGISRFKKFEWIYENLLQRPLSEEESQALGERFSNLVFEKVLRAPFINGALEFLNFLLENDKPAFIASGTPEGELQDIVLQRNLEQYFREVCGSPRSKTAIITELAAGLGIHPQEILFIGDASSDHQAAEETGTAFIAVDSCLMQPYWKEHGIIPISDLAMIPELYLKVQPQI